MNHQIYHLRHTQMEGKLQAQLSSIIYAYRPHDPIPTKDELEPLRYSPSGGDRVAHSYVSMRSICKQVGVNYRPQNMA